MQAVTFASLLANLFSQLPYYLVLLAGALVAVARWRRHPRASLLVVAGAVVLGLSSLASTSISWALPALAASRVLRFGYSRLANALGVCRSVLSVMAAIGYGLLLAAVFADRASEPEAAQTN